MKYIYTAHQYFSSNTLPFVVTLSLWSNAGIAQHFTTLFGAFGSSLPQTGSNFVKSHLCMSWLNIKVIGGLCTTIFQDSLAQPLMYFCIALSSRIFCGSLIFNRVISAFNLPLIFCNIEEYMIIIDWIPVKNILITKAFY